MTAHCLSLSQKSSAMTRALLKSLNQMRRDRRNGYGP